MALKLEVGKTYRTRGGHVVCIQEIRNDCAYFGRCDGGYRAWDESGSWRFDGEMHIYDLVAEAFPALADTVNELQQGLADHIEKHDLAEARQHSVALSCIMAAVEAANG